MSGKNKAGLISILFVFVLIALIVILNSQLSSTVQAADTKDDGKFYPGVYSEAEKEMLAKVQNTGGTFGSAPQVSTDAFMAMTADKKEMLQYANAFDYWNPLFKNEEYAKKTKYGSIIAVPFFKEAGAMFPTLGPNEKIGSWGGTNDGGYMEFFLPIKPGDTFTSKSDPPTVTDITPEEGSTTRTFEVRGSGSLYNQNSELVIKGEMIGRNSFRKAGASGGFGPGGSGSSGGQGAPGGQGGGQGGAPAAGGQGGPAAGGQGGPGGMGMSNRHKFTDDDYEKIHEIEDAEVVRGADTLYWEDVKVGDRPTWAIVGPTTTMDMIRCFGSQIISNPPMREQLKNKDRLPGLSQDAYGVYHLMEEGHFGDSGTAGRMPIYYMAFGRNHMVRLVTNYIGDEGWLRKFEWRNETSAKEYLDQVPELKGKSLNAHGTVGSVLIAKAYVTKKYIDESDKSHRIEMIVWTEENFEGDLCQAAKVTAILPSKDEVKKK
ncbi:MAG: MaoC family dehydratase [Deltaproteobacteria bacterium]|nr:MaoC family dehydratase [Deltaproteobacteria bacterium]